MKKRVISFILAACFAVFFALSALAATSLSNFDKIRAYEGAFADVSSEAWYYPYVSRVYEYGIMDGKSAAGFDPSGRLTIAEAIKIAAVLHKGYHTGTTDFTPAPGSQWYSPYVEYARKTGIPVNAYSNYNAAATRSDFALILAGAFPDEAVTPINRIADGAIPDVWESYSYGPAIYRFYRAGVLTGMDEGGSFYPGRSLTRAEAAAIIIRMVEADTRVSFSLAAELTAEQIYKLASPAVFYIEIFDEDEDLVKTGSGFFISESGLAVTNYHVVIGATTAKITTDSGDVLDIAGIYDYDWKKDIALIRIEGGGFPYLELADSELVQTGATVYTLGSPLGLQASFTRGIVSQSLREIEGSEYIQLDAPISSGSSGGALLDTSGKVAGITSATAIGAQNINLAVPINFLAGLNRESYVPLESILIPTEYYKDFFPAPDFGAFFGVSTFSTDILRTRASYSYLLSDLPGEPEDVIDEYKHLIEQNLFDRSGYTISDGSEFAMYYHPWYFVMITVGIEEIKGQDCVTVTVS